MNNVLSEGNLCFRFTNYDRVMRFDDKTINPYGLNVVDFIAENEETLYFIEVKDYQHPKSQRRDDDLIMLKEVVRDKKHIFSVQMGAKIKDSLLRWYAEGQSFNKKVVYLLFINLDLLGETERGILRAKISGHVPTGLNNIRFTAFREIQFDLVNADQLMKYGIMCTTSN